MITKFTNKHSYNHSDKFHQVCQPIFDQSPLTFCSMVRIFKDGTYAAFMSDPVWTDVYINKHYKPTASVWVETSIKLSDFGYCIWSLSDFFDTNADTKNLLHDCNLFHYNNGINIIDQHPDYYDVATFSSPKTEGIERYFIEKQDILRNYILYMKEQIFSDPELSNEFRTHYQLPTIINISETTHINDQAGFDIQKYYLGFPLRDDVYLTQREIDCLLPFLLGVPRKIISEHLKISTRTVETHLDNVKSKCIMTDSSKFRLSFTNNRYISDLLPNIFGKYL
jgi:LuxR family quorum-sensing system transcriptional regulator SolR